MKAGNGYVCGTQIEALIQLNDPNYVPQRWEGTLLFWATILVAVLINTVLGQLLPPIETAMLIIHVLGFFAILIPLVYVCQCFSDTQASSVISITESVADGTPKGNRP